MVVGEHKVNNIREQKKQTKAFIKRWENRGNERQDITSEIKTSNKSKNAIKRNIRSNSFQAEVAKSDYQTEVKENRIYDPLAKDQDGDGVIDRYDNDFKDSDYFESTYDVEDNLHFKEEATQKTEEKPSILGQIRAFQKQEKSESRQESKEQQYEQYVR